MFLVGIYLFLNEFFGIIYNGYVYELFVVFVKYFCEMYGDENVVYNIYGLVYLVE